MPNVLLKTPLSAVVIAKKLYCSTVVSSVTLSYLSQWFLLCLSTATDALAKFLARTLKKKYIALGIHHTCLLTDRHPFLRPLFHGISQHQKG